MADRLNIAQFVGAGDSCYGGGSGFGAGDGSGFGCGSGDICGFGYGKAFCDCSDCGDGSGAGDGSGFGNRNGCGYGCGSGCGSGDHPEMSPSGAGDGCGTLCFIRFMGERVWNLDGQPTILRRVYGNVAKGAILRNDLTLVPCHVVKQGKYFAHGATLHEAMEELRAKLFDDMPVEECIKAFLSKHKPGIKYPNRDFYDWHHRLTGSSDMVRRNFADSHGIDVEHGEMTVEEFIALTKNAYGGDIIRRMEKKMYGDGE